MDGISESEVFIKTEVEDDTINVVPSAVSIDQQSIMPVSENVNENPAVDKKKDDENDNDEEFIKITHKADGLVSLLVKDVEDNIEEETVIMTNEEVCDYIHEAFVRGLNDPKVNPLLRLDSLLTERQEQYKEKLEANVKLGKLFDTIFRQQGAFLRPNGILLKAESKEVGVSVDMPLLDTVPPKPVEKPKPSETTENIECIDLTDDIEPAKGDAASSNLQHPAPLPPAPTYVSNKDHPSPPKPRLKISAEERGIVLQWDLPSPWPSVSSFDIFGYQEQRSVNPATNLWKKIGSVRSMNLPMACTLTQFVEGHRYHFAIRAVDSRGRCGAYSDPISIVYKQNS